MFTGLIETTGELTEILRQSSGMVFGVKPGIRPFATVPGASISVNGACLTVESIAGEVVFFTAVGETLARTTLQKARVGDRVNLERALPVNGRMEGHFVLGHVDGVGAITFQRRNGNSMVCGIRAPEATRPYMAEKGSVAIDGISLTIAGYQDGEIEIAFIPYTLEHTSMARKRVGDEVNVECDVLARYIARWAQTETRGEGSIIDLLERSGF